MENAGAVFFRETLLLLDPATVSLNEHKRAAEVIAHELAHMWYGDLVTMAWWDDLWLNEAFATWMAYRVVDEWRPDWRLLDSFEDEPGRAPPPQAPRRAPARPLAAAAGRPVAHVGRGDGHRPAPRRPGHRRRDARGRDAASVVLRQRPGGRLLPRAARPGGSRRAARGPRGADGGRAARAGERPVGTRALREGFDRELPRRGRRARRRDRLRRARRPRRTARGHRRPGPRARQRRAGALPGLDRAPLRAGAGKARMDARAHRGRCHAAPARSAPPSDRRRRRGACRAGRGPQAARRLPPRPGR